MLYGAFHRARAVCWIVTFAEEQCFGCRSQFDRELTFRKALGEIAHLQLDDALDLIFAERFEHDDVVDSIQKLGTENFAQSGHGLFACFFRIFCSQLKDSG